jgi:uncharacterized caspase-like protein
MEMGQNMTTLAKLLATLAILLVGLTDLASAERRVALVIGNSAYENTTPLRNPRNDATALAAVLRKLDFEVLEGIDLDDSDFRRTAREFAVKIEDADVALFFYAGHGLQVNNRNYFMPVNAALKREADLDFEGVPLDLILKQMERGDRTNIVLLDACRNNPLAEKLARNMGTRSLALGRGLARVETGVGTYVGFSTQPGNVALDGEGGNSPFTQALLKNIEAPGVDIETLMRQVREEVIVATDGKQVPWGNSSLVGKGFFFNPAAPAVAEKRESEPAAAPTTTTTASPTASDQLNIEIAFWSSIKDSDDPSLLKAYLNEYPKGRFASLALIRLDRLAKAHPTPETVQPTRQEAAPQETPDAAEEGFWLAAKTSGDAKLFRRYLELYPYGSHVAEAKASIETTDRQIEVLPKDETPAANAETPPTAKVVTSPAASAEPAVATIEPAETAEPEAAEPLPAPPAKKVVAPKKVVVKQVIAPAKPTKQRTKQVKVASKQKKVQKVQKVQKVRKNRNKAPVIAVDVQDGAFVEVPFFGLRHNGEVGSRRRNQADSIVGPGSVAKQGGF